MLLLPVAVEQEALRVQIFAAVVVEAAEEVVGTAAVEFAVGAVGTAVVETVAVVDVDFAAVVTAVAVCLAVVGADVVVATYLLSLATTIVAHPNGPLPTSYCALSVESPPQPFPAAVVCLLLSEPSHSPSI